MTQRVKLTLFICTATLFTAQAQWSKQDSIRLQHFLQGEEAIQMNGDVAKTIEFDFTSKQEEWKGKPLISEEKPWMNFLNELPKNFGDTTKWKKPTFIRLTPYTPYTKWNEDPVNDPIFVMEDTLNIGRWILNTKAVLGLRGGYRVLPSGMDQSTTPSNNPLSTFDADKALYETFSKRGRSIRRNRSNAVAWKSYQYHIPTSTNSLPTDTLLLTQDTIQQKNEPLPLDNDSLYLPIDSISPPEDYFLKMK
ncbi:MAG: DUF4858 domain-containing protein [Phocaeicola sp.]